MGSTFSIKGKLTTEAGDALPGARILAFNEGSFEKPAFRVQATSDGQGFFETASVFSYACTSFQVEISASGYQTQRLTFYPPGEQWPGELPSELNLTLIAGD